MPPQNRYGHIDSLRAIAALLVLWMHTGEVFVSINGAGGISGAWLNEIASTLDVGRIGVVLFFFISGFVIPSSLTGEPRQGATTFIIRRFFRLYPAYWLSLPLGLLTIWWAFDRPITSWDVAANLTMIQEVFGAPDIEGLYWTLRIELIFYGVCLVLFLKRVLHLEKVLIVAASAMLLVFAAAVSKAYFGRSFLPGWLRAHYLLLGHLSIMFTGALWRRAYEGAIGRRGKLFLGVSTLWWIVLFPSIALYLFLHNGVLELPQKRQFFSYPLATGIFILGLYARAAWRPVAWLGEISYSLYLFHPVVFYGLFWLLLHSPYPWMRAQHLGVYILVVAVLTIAVSALVYAFVEKPMIRLGRRLSAPTPGPKISRPLAEAA